MQTISAPHGYQVILAYSQSETYLKSKQAAMA